MKKTIELIILIIRTIFTFIHFHGVYFPPIILIIVELTLLVLDVCNYFFHGK